NYAFVLSNRYGQPQSPLPYGYGAPMGGGYPGATNCNPNQSTTGIGALIATSCTIFNNSLYWVNPLISNRNAYNASHTFPKGSNQEVIIRTPFININTNSKVLNTISKTTKIAGVAGTLATMYDIGTALFDGHYAVGSAKICVAAIETTITLFIPGGAFIAMGIAIIDYSYGDLLYQYIDPTYHIAQ
ncbi:MAG: hypothetical protein IJ775_05445, partial [Muribaculaceae bacterium]|nr:hypothetical protein [Muribaculaceae bacterium]